MTDEVLNQPPPLEGYDAYASDGWLTAAVRRANAGWIAGAASDLGRFAGSREAQELASAANRNPPQLLSHDRFGRRIDVVEYHPSYHTLMHRAIGGGVHSLAWKRLGARRALLPVEPARAGHGVPGHDDVCVCSCS